MQILLEEKKTKTSPGGLEPPTFRLTAERANRLRHGDLQYHAMQYTFSTNLRSPMYYSIHNCLGIG